MRLRELVLGAALATGLAGCAITAPVVFNMKKYVVEDNGAMTTFYTGGLFKNPSGEFIAIDPASSCAATTVFKAERKGSSMVNQYCDGTVDLFIEMDGKGEYKYTLRKENEDCFVKTLDPSFKKLKSKIGGDKK